MSTSTESALGRVNRNHFLREFTYSNQRFTTAAGSEDEFTDSAVWIDDLLILQEIKERDRSKLLDDPQKQIKWYENKIRKKAVNQLVKTTGHLATGSSLLLRNERGETVDLSNCDATTRHLLVVFTAPPFLPVDLVRRKAYVSKRIGFVHFMTAADYENVCAALFTPFEIAEYFSWRKGMCLRLPADCDGLNEKALVGQFVAGEDDEPPTAAFEEYVDHLNRDVEEENIFGILGKFVDRIESGKVGRQYYHILKELAKLTRGLMQKFLDRLRWSMEECRRESPGLPTRMSLPQHDVSFVIIPLSRNEAANWRSALESFTYLSKYLFKTTKAIGLTVAPCPESTEHYLINWCYVESPWEYDEKTDDFLKETNPFRPAKETLVGKYTFE